MTALGETFPGSTSSGRTCERREDGVRCDASPCQSREIPAWLAGGKPRRADLYTQHQAELDAILAGRRKPAEPPITPTPKPGPTMPESQITPGSHAARALARVRERPDSTTREIADILDVSSSTALTALRRLAQLGLVHERGTWPAKWRPINQKTPCTLDPTTAPRAERPAAGPRAAATPAGSRASPGASPAAPASAPTPRVADGSTTAAGTDASGALSAVAVAHPDSPATTGAAEPEPWPSSVSTGPDLTVADVEAAIAACLATEPTPAAEAPTAPPEPDEGAASPAGPGEAVRRVRDIAALLRCEPGDVVGAVDALRRERDLARGEVAGLERAVRALASIGRPDAAEPPAEPVDDPTDVRAGDVRRVVGATVLWHLDDEWLCEIAGTVRAFAGATVSSWPLVSRGVSRG